MGSRGVAVTRALTVAALAALALWLQPASARAQAAGVGLSFNGNSQATSQTPARCWRVDPHAVVGLYG